MLRSNYKLGGFSLIELLVAIAVLGILFAVGAPSFNSWIHNSQIRTGAQSILSGLQLARAEAVQRNATVQFSFGAGTSWSVGCVTVAATCPAVIQSYSNLEGSSNAVVNAGQAVIAFNGLGRQAVVVGVTPNPVVGVDIDISNPVGGNCLVDGGVMRCLRVSVAAGGQIRMCDPSLSLATNPQGCV